MGRNKIDRVHEAFFLKSSCFFRGITHFNIKRFHPQENFLDLGDEIKTSF